MNNPADLDLLNRKVTQLKQLLDDQHPGLSTWMLGVRDAMQDLYTEMSMYQWLTQPEVKQT